ncbi:MAG: DUF3726 domain-containing protein [Gammaproteobacteria bacterium]|nr:DUF3726 domain-containing protein [Gammaproteobacteria bacterium]
MSSNEQESKRMSESKQGFFSLNQIDQTCRKAARGVGLPWGAADDIGKAARWLSAYELTSVPQIVELLEAYEPDRYEDVIPQNLASPLQPGKGRLNPLITGMVLSDLIDEIKENPMVTGRLDYPIFTAGFLGQTALTEDRAIRLSWAGIALVFYRDALIIEGNRKDLELEFCETLECERVNFSEIQTDQKNLLKPVMASVKVTWVIWQKLEKLAHHTYVEATEQSRQSGAGAGLNDND